MSDLWRNALRDRVAAWKFFRGVVVESAGVARALRGGVIRYLRRDCFGHSRAAAAIDRLDTSGEERGARRGDCADRGELGVFAGAPGAVLTRSSEAPNIKLQAPEKHQISTTTTRTRVGG